MLVRGLLSPFLTLIQITSLQGFVHISFNKQIKKCVSNMFFTRERERDRDRDRDQRTNCYTNSCMERTATILKTTPSHTNLKISKSIKKIQSSIEFNVHSSYPITLACCHFQILLRDIILVIFKDYSWPYDLY